MELHHSKHHQTYVTNLNNALSTLAQKPSDVPAQIALQSAVKFNGGGYVASFSLPYLLFFLVLDYSLSTRLRGCGPPRPPKEQY